MHVIVDQRGQQVVGGTDRMEIAGKMQVDIGHGDDLRITAARRAAFHTETRPEARLAKADRGLLADQVHGVAEAHRRGRLALAGRRRRNSRDEDQLAVRLVAIGVDEVGTDLRLVMPVRNQSVRRYPQLGANFLDRKNICSPCDLDIRLNAHFASPGQTCTSVLGVRIL